MSLSRREGDAMMGQKTPGAFHRKRPSASMLVSNIMSHCIYHAGRGQYSDRRNQFKQKGRRAAWRGHPLIISIARDAASLIQAAATGPHVALERALREE